jgi:hypothetical protein
MKYFLGIDNGVSGSLSMLDEMGNIKFFINTPCFKEQNYTKKEYIINRINTNKLFEILTPYVGENVRVMLERPLVNNSFFSSTCSAMRSLEATLIVLEKLKFKYEFLDSTEWQNELLPEYWRGELVEKKLLKIASLEVGKQLYPQTDFSGFKDADGLLISHYCKQKYGGNNELVK